MPLNLGFISRKISESQFNWNFLVSFVFSPSSRSFVIPNTLPERPHDENHCHKIPQKNLL